MVRVIKGKIQHECEWCHAIGTGNLFSGHKWFCSQVCQNAYNNHKQMYDVVIRHRIRKPIIK